MDKPVANAEPTAELPTAQATKPRRWMFAARAVAFVLVVVLQLSWEQQSLPIAMRVFHITFIALAVWRPAAALLMLAAAGPLSGDLVRILGGQPEPSLSPVATFGRGTRFLEQMCLAVLSGWLIRWPSVTSGLRLPRPAFFVGAVAITSAAVVLPARLIADSGDLNLINLISPLWHGTDLTLEPAWRPLFAALYVVEGVALACVAEWIFREKPNLISRLVSLLLISHAVLALLTIVDVARVGVIRTQDLAGLSAMLLSTRASRYTDPNATAAVFVMIVMAGLMLPRQSNWRSWWTPPALLIVLGGILLSGSRTALASLTVGLLALLVVRAVQSRERRKQFALAAGLVLVILGLLAVLRLTARRNDPLSYTVASRVMITEAALKMAASAPLFGVGIGTFWDRSSEFGTSDLPDLASRYHIWWTEPHENAHNNFLQVLAEEGIVGLIAVCGLLWSVLLAPGTSRAATNEWTWLAGSLGSFLLAWLTGHPMLVLEAAFVFWLLFGSAAALTRPSAPPTHARRWHWALLALVATVPPRIWQDVKTAEYPGFAVDVSSWQKEPDGTSYRSAGSNFSLFVPANKLVAVPVRRAPGAPAALRLDFRVNKRLVNSVMVTGDAWQTVNLTIPAKHRRYVRLDFSLQTSVGPAPPMSLYVGRDRSQ